jgi:hypothetical protein
MSAELRLLDPRTREQLPSDLFPDVNLGAPQATTRTVLVRNVGDRPAKQVVVEATDGLEVSHGGTFGQSVRLGDLGPDGEMLVKVRRPVRKSTGRQTATLSVRGLMVT